ncbi:MAG: radical SAM protein [Deltaproteobacteria bacterium]|nr:radical SAM protein [Deltaproteobacteria bacterium]
MITPRPSHFGLVDDDFRRNRVVPLAPPTRFQLNLTERCNLRCRHCITDAPRRTQDGSARDLTPDVLEALRPHLIHADYIGLTHAGEPTIAPLLEPFLEGVRERRPVVHLVTNGKNLDRERFLRLERLGVCSWSFSVDGLASHDVLRRGSSIDRLSSTLSLVSRMRQSTTRMGISCTVTRDNSHELAGLLELAKELRLDWVKLEELVPIGGVEGPTNLHEVIDALLAQGDRLGLPVLDHTRPPPFECQLEAAAEARRSRLDDFVNHAAVNACRLPYELVCVEPNGDVKPNDFHQPPAGNVLERSLDEIWRGAGFVLARNRRLLARPCRAGRPTCPSDPGPEAW